MYRSKSNYNICYACCGITIMATCIAMIIYGTHNIYTSGYNGMSCSGNNITNMNITNTENCYIIDFTTCVYNNYICNGKYYIKYPLNNTCVNNNTMIYIVNNIINKTEFTCYINRHHGTIIDNKIIYISNSMFIIFTWCMLILILLFFCIYCYTENCKDNRTKEYYLIA